MARTPKTGRHGATRHSTHPVGKGGGFVLGVNDTGYHDSSLAVVDRACEIAYAAAEERYTRYKKESRFPRHELRIVADNFPGIEAIGVAGAVPIRMPEKPDPFWHDERLMLDDVFPVKPLSFDTKPFEALWPGRPFYRYDHHLCHAAAGFFMSGLDRALVITCDGGMEGCLWNAGVYTARAGAGIEFLHGRLQSHYVQLVRLYTDVTAILGFRPNLHEGKITGLAGRGKPNPACEAKLLEIEQELNRAPIPLYFWVGLHDDELPSSLEVNHRMAVDLRARLGAFSREDIARAVQSITERRILHYVRRAREETGENNLILAGGLFANVKINLECKRVGFEQIFVCPPMSDEGLSLGAAVLAAAEHWGEPLPSKAARHLFLAETPDAAALPALLDSMGIVSERPGSLHKRIAAELAAGRTVARVLGAMEYGPRALGHRSIFYQPTDPSVNDWLNHKLRRSEFMPFAPVIRAERAAEMFDELSGAELTARFMTICLPCKPDFARKCPAVVHVDNTARPQIVDRESAPDTYAILEAYEALTGLPAFINTSFNVHDEPIVHSHEDAIVAFFQSELDVLAIEDRLVYRDKNPAAARLVGATTTENVRQERNLRYRAEYEMGGLLLNLGEYVKDLNKATGYLEDEVAARERHIEQLLEAKVYHEGKIGRLEGAITALEQARAYLEGSLKEREAYVEELLQAKQYGDEELARRAAAVEEKEQARAYLEGRLKEREDYVEELLQAKQYLEGRLADREQYANDLIEAKAYLGKELKARDERLAERERYIEELLQAKQYLDGELARRAAGAEEIEQGHRYLEERLAERERYIEELLQAKQYLDGELARRAAGAEEIERGHRYLEERLAEREAYVGELLKAKAYLEGELAQREAAVWEGGAALERVEARLAEREHYVKDILAAKQYLDEELERRGAALAELETGRAHMQERLAEREHYVKDILAAKRYLDEDLERRGAALAELETERAHMQERLAECERYMTEIAAGKQYLDEELERRGAAIERLEATNRDLEAAQSQWEARDGRHREAFDELRGQAERLRADVQRLGTLLDERAARIRLLEARIAAFTASPVLKIIRPFSKTVRNLTEHNES